MQAHQPKVIFDYATGILFTCLMLATAATASAPLTAYALLTTALIAILIAEIYLIRFLHPAWTPVRPHPFSMYLFCFCLMLFPASVTGIAPMQSIAISTIATLFFVTFFAIREAFTSHAKGFLSPTGFAAILASGCSLAVLLRLATHVTGHSGSVLPWYCLAPPDLNAGQPFDRIFSFFLVGALPMIMAGAMNTTAYKRFLFVIGSTVVSTGILLSFSRAAWVAIAAQAGVLIVLNRRARRWLPILALCFGLAALFIPAVANRGRAVTSLHEGSNSSRLEFWSAGMEMVAKSPFLGCGPGAFGDAYTQLENRIAPTTVPCPHNLLLRIATECGLPALCIFTSIVFGILRNLTRKANRTEREHADVQSAFRFAGALSFVGLLIFSLFHM